MHNSASFQQAFGDALMRDGAWPDRRVERALLVHRNTAAKAAQDALFANFPVCAALIGANVFGVAAAQYVERSPPSDARLCCYGAEFCSFLGDHRLLADLPYLRDVARLEWSVIEALFAADAEPLDGTALGSRLDLETPLRLHPAARWTASDHPIASIWHAHQEAGEADALERIAWQPEALLITRPADAVLVTIVPADAVAFLDACAEGRPLGEAAALVGDGLPHLFSTLIAAGAFA